MPLERVGPYFLETDTQYPKVIHVPAQESQDWAKRLNDKGLFRYVGLESTGDVGGCRMWVVERLTPYSGAMLQIANLESNGILQPGSYDEAFIALATGTFDNTVWTTYLEDIVED